MTLDDVEAMKPILENVGRLIDDATLLVRNERLASAFVLNVIALEEVGKVIHMRWKHLDCKTTRQDRTGHLQKQWAVACVLIAKKLLPLMKEMILRPDEWRIDELERLAGAFMDSGERRFFEKVIAKNLDRAKQLGLYEDETNARDGITRDVIDHVAILEVSRPTLDAMQAMSDEVILQVASVFYEIMPPLQADILAAAQN